MIRFVATLLAALAATVGAAHAQSDLVKRGDYLVNTDPDLRQLPLAERAGRRHSPASYFPAGCPGMSRRSR